MFIVFFSCRKCCYRQKKKSKVIRKQEPAGAHCLPSTAHTKKPPLLSPSAVPLTPITKPPCRAAALAPHPLLSSTPRPRAAPQGPAGPAARARGSAGGRASGPGRAGPGRAQDGSAGAAPGARHPPPPPGAASPRRGAALPGCGRHKRFL